MITKKIDPWFEENLVCPIDKSKLTINNNNFVCSTHQHKYEIYNNIPIMLVNEYIKSKNDFTIRSLKILKEKKYIDEYYNSNLKSDAIDGHVQNVVAATNSNFYKPAIGKLKKYPIPIFPIINNQKNLLLDIGCGWGRWSFSAYNNGFDPVGIDPSIKSVVAATKVAKQLGVKSRFIVGDACHMPFKENLFNYCFSYSVLQHFSREDVLKTLKEIQFTLKPNGVSQIQMLNKFGLRSIYALTKKIFNKEKYFDTNYYSPKQLKLMFKSNIGETKIEIGSFFTQAQITDFKLFTTINKIILIISIILKRLSSFLPFLKNLGDNLFLISKK